MSTIYGSYMGYLDFNGQRYWDARELCSFEQYECFSLEKSLPSDSRKRIDSNALQYENESEAQRKKEILEEAQRYDKKLRDQCDARRAKKGGKKFGNIF